MAFLFLVSGIIFEQQAKIFSLASPRNIEMRETKANLAAANLARNSRTMLGPANTGLKLDQWTGYNKKNDSHAFIL